MPETVLFVRNIFKARRNDLVNINRNKALKKMKKIKLLAGILLVLSLTLPLSTCTSIVHEINSNSTQEVSKSEVQTKERYLVSVENSPFEWMWVASFFLPLGLTIATYKKRPTLISEIVTILSVSPAVYILWWHTATGVLATGGYIAVAAVVLFLILVIYSIVRLFSRSRCTAQNDAPEV